MKHLSIIIILSFILFGNAQKQYIQSSTYRNLQPDTILNDSTKKTIDFLKEVINQKKDKKKTISKDAEIEINGLIIDETKTKAGHDFYDKFFTSWEAPAEAKNYSIKIKEIPFRMSLTIIIIEVNNNGIFKSYLQPRQSLIDNMAKQAINITTQYLENQKQIQKQLKNEDENGSGIY